MTSLRLPPTPALRLVGGLVLAVLSLVAAYGIMWWTRGLALPVLFLVGFWYWLLRSETNRPQFEVGFVKAWCILVAFFLIGPLVVHVLRLAFFVLLVLVAFRPGGQP